MDESGKDGKNFLVEVAQFGDDGGDFPGVIVCVSLCPGLDAVQKVKILRIGRRDTGGGLRLAPQDVVSVVPIVSVLFSAEQSFQNHPWVQSAYASARRRIFSKLIGLSLNQHPEPGFIQSIEVSLQFFVEPGFLVEKIDGNIRGHLRELFL